MATLTRYVVAELLKILLLWLGLFTGLMLFVFLGQEAWKQGISPLIVLQLAPFLLPQTLVYAIPATTLLAVCIVYGRISSANEVVAIKSLGIKPMVLAWPAFALSFVLSLVCVWLNDIAFSWGETGVQRVILHSVEEIVYGVLRTHGVYSNKRMSILVREVDGRRLVRPVINFYSTDDSDLAFTILADEAELQSNLENNTLRLVLVNSVIDGGGSLQGEYPGRWEREIPLTFASAKGELEIGPGHISMIELPRAIREQNKRIRQEREILAAEMGFNLISGEILDLNEPNWQAKRRSLQTQVSRLHRLQTEPYRRTASGFMCLFFTLVGVPWAIRMRNADPMTSFGVCFVPILFMCFPTFFYCLNAAKLGQIHPVTIWSANLVCAALGWWLWKWVDRY